MGGGGGVLIAGLGCLNVGWRYPIRQNYFFIQWITDLSSG